MNKQTVTIRIKNITGSEKNNGLLSELSKDANIKEGDIIEDVSYNPNNGACEFERFNVIKINCVAWVGQTCEIIDEKKRYEKQ